MSIFKLNVEQIKTARDSGLFERTKAHFLKLFFLYFQAHDFKRSPACLCVCAGGVGWRQYHAGHILSGTWQGTCCHLTPPPPPARSQASGHVIGSIWPDACCYANPQTPLPWLGWQQASGHVIPGNIRGACFLLNPWEYMIVANRNHRTRGWPAHRKPCVAFSFLLSGCSLRVKEEDTENTRQEYFPPFPPSYRLERKWTLRYSSIRYK